MFWKRKPKITEYQARQIERLLKTAPYVIGKFIALDLGLHKEN